MRGKPWMKFYPADWRSDPKLRMCSPAARGLWMELICLMHESDLYGHLLVNRKLPNDTQIGALTGIDPSTVRTLISELEEAGVFSRNRAGVIYSRRMVEDEKKAAVARRNGQTGGNPTLCNETPIPPSDNPPVNPAVNGEDKAQRPEARQEKENKNPPSSPPLSNGDDFDAFWAAYPSRGDATNPKKPARLKFAKLVADGVPPAVLVAGAKGYAAAMQREKKHRTPYVKQAITFLNEECYEQYAGPAAAPDEIDWPKRLDRFRRSGLWVGDWGPKPTEPNCWAPPDLLSEWREARTECG